MLLDTIVCVRRVRQTTPAGQSIINPLDRNALEEALRIRERFGGKVIALTMGSPPARRALEEALAMGADEAIFLFDQAFSGADTLATAYTLAYGIRRLGHFELILCGNESMTGATGHVGPQLAELLDIAHVTCAKAIDFVAEKTLLVKRALETGYMKVRVALPALIAVVKEINKPRLATVWGIMEAAQKEVKVWDSKDIGAEPNTVGLEGSPTRVIREFEKQFARRREILQGPPEEVVKKAMEKLRELGAA